MTRERNKYKARNKYRYTPNGRRIHRDDTPEDQEEENILIHEFPVRPELSILIGLPSDLTETEANRLASFVRLLPCN
jgi:hypothetical protein